MPFTSKNLAPIGNTSFGVQGLGEGTDKLVGAPRIWSYITDDASTTVDTAGYFNDVADIVKAGDIIFLVSTDAGNSAGTIAGVRIMVVLTNDGTTVDVSNGTTVSLSDTD